MHQLENIFDHEDERHSFYEEVELNDGSRYLRTKKGMTGTYKDTAGTKIDVPGIILSVDKHVLRTDGIIVEALLGQAEGLDAYSRGLQEQTVMAKRLGNRLTELEVERGRLGAKLVETVDEEGAKVFERVFPSSTQKVSPEATVRAGEQLDGSGGGNG